MTRNVEKNNNPVNIRFDAKASDIRKLSENIASDVMLKYQKWQHWYQWSWTSGAVEVAAAQLHLCFVINGNVWWKSTFRRMVTIAVLHHKHMKRVKPFKAHVVSVATARVFSLDLGFFCLIWGSGVFIENLGFFDVGQILEMYVVLLYFPMKNAVSQAQCAESVASTY